MSRTFNICFCTKDDKQSTENGPNGIIVPCHGHEPQTRANTHSRLDFDSNSQTWDLAMENCASDLFINVTLWAFHRWKEERNTMHPWGWSIRWEIKSKERVSKHFFWRAPHSRSVGEWKKRKGRKGRKMTERKKKRKSASTSAAGQQQTGSPVLFPIGLAIGGATISACGRDNYALLVGSAAVETLWIDALDACCFCWKVQEKKKNMAWDGVLFIFPFHFQSR